MTVLLLTVIASYLLGSIPFGLILVRLVRGEDVRKTGSGNIGATNVARSSAALGVLTLILDALKGSAAIFVSLLLSQKEIVSWAYATVPWFPDHFWPALPAMVSIRAGAAALSAVLGHVFPVWLKFRGGKGVATGLGSFLMLAPRAVLVTACIFAVVVLAFRYVSLGSMVAVAGFPLLAWGLHEYGDRPLVLVFMATAAGLIIARHHQNIRRLMAGTEPHFMWRRKNGKP